MEFKLLSNSRLEVTVDRNIYNMDIVHKCFYWYGNKFSVNISQTDRQFIIELVNSDIEGKHEILINKIKTDLIDFKTRDIIAKETTNIRELLIAKAFAHGEEFDENPPGDLDDPIGFSASEI